MIEIGRLPPDRWPEYRALRLEALESDPAAFGSSTEDEAGVPEADWRKRSGNMLFAFAEGKPVGMLGFMTGPRLKTRHTADMFSFYVRPDERGKGVGWSLLEGALKEVAARPGVVKVKLFVNPEQKAAVSLYRKAGFREVGTLRRELKLGDRYCDELLMEKQLRD